MRKIALVAMLLCSTSVLAQKPLSCEMQMMLTAGTAMERDMGKPREKTVVGLNADRELTNREIKKILDRVYVQGKYETIDQIKDDVYRQCKRGK